MCWMLDDERVAHHIVLQAFVFVFGLFAVCMVCHGELARDRPPPQQLTQFYLCVAAGGAFGGAIVGLGAPAILPGYLRSRDRPRAGDAGHLVAIVAALRVWARPERR